MKIFENKDWPGFYLLEYGSESLLIKYRHEGSSSEECQKTEIDMSGWIEITEPKN